MKIVLAQINSTVGDFEGNYQKMKAALHQAADVDLVIFPECALCGYPQRDLLDYSEFASEAEKYADRLIREESNKAFIFGSIEKNRGPGKPFFNTAIFADRGRILGKYSKRLLPTYDVFDEDRFFEPGRSPLSVDFRGQKIGLTICEDIWSNEMSMELHNRYNQVPLDDYQGVPILINISASPFEFSKVHVKRRMLQEIARKQGSLFIYCNSVGANDDLIFDGRSYVWSPSGDLVAEGRGFKEHLILIDSEALRVQPLTEVNDIENIYDALVLGIRDYCSKQNFHSVTLGLSGGVDSSLVACLASDAIGVENVVGVLMPSRFTSNQSNQDAIVMASRMKNPIHILSIEEIFKASLFTLEKTFEGLEPNIAEENIQARIRGMLLMALSNKFGHLVLTTGNKSELSVGYCTLYGDMCGGLAPLADVYKTQVYELAREANRRSQRIPESVFEKAPTAELRPNQKDQDTLPPYERLDRILKLIVEDSLSPEEVIHRGFERIEVFKIFQWVGSSEYKRYQMPLGLKVSKKAFGVGRRIPLVQKYL